MIIGLKMNALKRIRFNKNKISLARHFCDKQEKTTHFGYQTVTTKEKSEKVHQVFSKVASRYDLTNDAMSIGVHRLWKKRFIEVINPLPKTNLLDVAGGTGDIAFRFLDYTREFRNCKQSTVTICDFSEEMLEIGKQRAHEHGYDKENSIKWIHGDAQCLPFEDNTFDLYTIAFGIRNVVDVQKALDESYRVLKPGGMFACLEFSQIQNPLLEKFYDWYSFQIIPVIGEVIAGDWRSYQYLVESIRKFPDQNDFQLMIKSSGFTLTKYENLSFGIAAIHTGYKRN